MIEQLSTIFSYEFMRNALIASFWISLAAGVIGALVVLNRIVSISGGIAHAAYGGVGIAYYFGQDPMIGALLFSTVSALIMGAAQRKSKSGADTLIGVMWSIGMAIGIIFISLTRGYKANLMSYLFGSILAVSGSDLRLMTLVAALVLGFVIFNYRNLLAISYDETFSTVRNLPVTLLYLTMLVLVGLTVVVAMRMVGLILVIALLSIPPAIALYHFKDVRAIMLISVVLSFLFCFFGLVISFQTNIQAGPVIILLASVAFLLSSLVRRLHLSRKS
ncbi:MAG: metal ABC transporter permease [Anaerolineaceae bacterium]|jgi:zinc transport system permease protein|nr:metal ABC transporter permease [Anaerolineaceae bacterium]MDD4042741.1 metal ABC transporter permease [Anaerolineaceae bacterium]MDD4577852.1 metal ABC transporter permease [Anaerolineaceae bacterium]